MPFPEDNNDAPQELVQRLVRWLEAWQLENQLTEAFHELTARPSSESAFRIVEKTKSDQSTIEVRPYDTAETALRPGAIRLMGEDALPKFPRLLYVAVLRQIDEELLLVAPFSSYAEPATKGELLTEREDSPLRVLELWCAHTVPREIIAKGWLVDSMTQQEQDDAWAVFNHVFTGWPLPEHVKLRVGLPIRHPRDPRIEYQQSEMSLFRPWREFASSVQETTKETEDLDPFPVELLNVVEWSEGRELPVAALGRVKPSRRAPFIPIYRAIEGTDLILSIKRQSDGKTCRITILEHKQKPPSNKLDGAAFVPSRGRQVIIRRGQATCPLSAIHPHGFKLVGQDGSRLRLRHLT
jgi:hypothetical protein